MCISFWHDMSFWRDVSANFISDFVASVVLASLLTLFISKRLTNFEQRLQRKEEKRNDIEKAIRYLKLLKDEVKAKISTLPNLIHIFENETTIEQKTELAVNTPFWDTLQPSGELPKLLNPEILASLTEFYEYLGFTQRVMDRFFPREKHNIFGFSSFQKSSLIGLKQSLKFGKDLPARIDTEIQHLKSNLDNL